VSTLHITNGDDAGDKLRSFVDGPVTLACDVLHEGRVPLVTVGRGPDGVGLRERSIEITAAGRDVLAHRADHVRLNGIDVWRRGVHLSGSDRSPWRWDAHRETLVS
jgi:hypothetical protein